eukprot:scaffold192116_cov18-Tisochrysis_lutea.AAC.2
MTHALQQKDQALTALEEIVAELQGELQALQADQDLSLSQVQQLQEKLARKNATVTKLQKDVQALQEELEQKEQAAQHQLVALKAEHESTVQAAAPTNQAVVQPLPCHFLASKPY